ncbi:MAG: AI-2E family transporter [Candidatus Levyibacteriota bacterium]
MTIRLRTVFFIILALLTCWFLYLERAILAPFVLAAIFAYIFNPVVSFLSSKIKLPRTISIILIWAIIIGVLIVGGMFIVRRAVVELAGLKEYIQDWTAMAKTQAIALPEFVRPTLNETLSSLQKTVLTTSISLFSVFPQAVSGVISFFIFLVSSFYFLKEGRNVFDKFLNFIPQDYRLEAEILLRKINEVLGDYLRGQLLVILTSFLLFFAFYTIIGVKFALMLALVAGFLEVVVLIGPLVSGVLAVIVVLLSGVSNFNLSLLQAVAVVIVGNFIIRQIQDYVITPGIMGKVVKLHPLIILFAVLAGGHMAGILGLVLAVPIAAVIRIILLFVVDKINEKKQA